MRELRVDIGGSTRGFQRATDEAVGIARSLESRMEEQHKKESSAYSSWWSEALEKREAAEKILTEKRLAEIEEIKTAQLAANLEIMQGSGGQAWRANAVQRAGGKGTAGMVASQAAMDAMNGGFKEAGKNAAMLAGSLHVAHMAERVMEGKNPLAGIARLPHAIMETVEGLVKWAPMLARVTGITAILAESFAIASAAVKSGRAASDANESQQALGMQSGDLKARLTDYISDQVTSGKLSQQEADRLRAMLTSHEGIVRAQRELVAMQDKTAGDRAAKLAADAPFEERKAAADSERNQLQEKDHTEAEYARDLQFRLEGILNLKQQMARLDKDATEYKRLDAIMSESQLQIEKDRQALQKFHDKPEAFRQSGAASHVDSMSSAGLFQSLAGASNNPVL